MDAHTRTFSLVLIPQSLAFPAPRMGKEVFCSHVNAKTVLATRATQIFPNSLQGEHSPGSYSTESGTRED